jgi:nucleotide-binding universal stress UspA family protein
MRSFVPKKILVPTDLSDASNAALANVRVFMEKYDAEVTVLHAERIEVPPYFTSSQLDELAKERQTKWKEAADYVSRSVAPVLGRVPETIVAGGAPTDLILKTIEEKKPDLVIMGTHGRSGTKRFWMGSVTERVIRRGGCPVLAVRADGRPELKRILGAISAEDTEGVVLSTAASLASDFDADLSAVHATGSGELLDSCPGVSEEIRNRCRIEESLARGDAAENILRLAQEIRPDVIVMGGRRRVMLFGELFSTTTDKVMRAAATSLLVVPMKDVEE